MYVPQWSTPAPAASIIRRIDACAGTVKCSVEQDLPLLEGGRRSDTEALGSCDDARRSRTLGKQHKCASRMDFRGMNAIVALARMPTSSEDQAQREKDCGDKLTRSDSGDDRVTRCTLQLASRRREKQRRGGTRRRLGRRSRMNLRRSVLPRHM